VAIASEFERGWPGAPELYTAVARAYARIGWDRLADECHRQAWALSADIFSENFHRANVAVEAPAELLADEAVRQLEADQ